MIYIEWLCFQFFSLLLFVSSCEISLHSSRGAVFKKRWPARKKIVIQMVYMVEREKKIVLNGYFLGLVIFKDNHLVFQNSYYIVFVVDSPTIYTTPCATLEHYMHPTWPKFFIFFLFTSSHNLSL